MVELSHPASRERVRGPLRPVELAAVAIFGGLAVASVVVAAVIPMASAAGLLAPVPLALVAERTRPRGFIAAAVATVAVCFAVAGTTAAFGMFSAAVIGGLVGEIKRRRRGTPTFLLWSAVAAPAFGALSVLILWILVPLRELALAAIENLLDGFGRLAEMAGAGGVGSWFRGFGDSIVNYWWAWMLGSSIIGTVLSLLVAWWLVGKVIDRLADVPSEDSLEADPATEAADPGPLPLIAEQVSFRYPRGDRDVLAGVDLELHQGEFVAIVGANGSGKSTLAKLLAGRAPTAGRITRPGAAGLGRFGGTAMVLQRPETQMLGARVADDLVWGLPPGTEVDVPGLLAEVGLAGLEGRDTSDLSGGQQQRLAIAAALARRPALLIADEVTSMVDPTGRQELLTLLASLPGRLGITVVLITHRHNEAAAADRVIRLAGGRVVEHFAAWMQPEPLPLPPPRVTDRRPLLVLDQVGHTYMKGSPWQVTALDDISLTVYSGDGLLIVGGNGSGKTTLAWIMAGLMAPTDGSADLDGQPVRTRIGKAVLGFQHARLQLLKPTVGEEIMSAGGGAVGSAEVGRVLDLVNLPREMAAARVDSLSGGQMRRVVLASLIARRPEILILDEPLAGLDPDAREGILDVLASLRAQGLTIIIISHDLESLERVCNRRVSLVGGRIVDENQEAVR